MRIYPFRSAVIKYIFEASFTGTRVKYIDNYGYLQAEYTDKAENFGGNRGRENTVIIIKGERVYIADLLKGTLETGRNMTYGYYAENREKDSALITETILHEAEGWHKEGDELFLNRECTKWKAGKNTLLTWQGIMMMKVLNFMTMTVEKASTVEINVKIQKHVFRIPDGLKYIPADIYYGPPGLKPDFGGSEARSTDNGNGISVAFDSAGLKGCGSFLYRDRKENGILLSGDNDFNKIDSEIIRSQHYAMSEEKILLPPSKTLVFITKKGLGGKIQINRSTGDDYSFRYMIFDDDGTVLEYSADTNNVPGPILEIEKGKNGELIIKSLNNTGYTIL